MLSASVMKELKTKIVALNEFILEQLYEMNKSVEDLRNKRHQHASGESPEYASFKEEADYL